MLHLDADLMVVAKPPGLLAVPGRGVDKQDCLSARLAAAHGDIHVVHRLDQATSGLMVFARNLTALRHLQGQFAHRTVLKRYVAVVHGQLKTECLEIALPLMADWEHRPRQKVDVLEGKPSLTVVRCVGFDASTNTSRLSLVPQTGRTHQLRVHLQAIGHPIVGDTLYGTEAASDGAAHLLWRKSTPRLMLHACELGFVHPATGRSLLLVLAADF
jgi:tRNA pseudouridine32 synthase / 23S rRNA pseudouridine746 synthase